jgi:hypothetical protein
MGIAEDVALVDHWCEIERALGELKPATVGVGMVIPNREVETTAYACACTAVDAPGRCMAGLIFLIIVHAVWGKV